MVMMGSFGNAHVADVVYNFTTSACHAVNAHLPKACSERSCCQLTVGQTRRSAWLYSDACAHSTTVWSRLPQLWQCGGRREGPLRHVPCQHGTAPADSPAVTFILVLANSRWEDVNPALQACCVTPLWVCRLTRHYLTTSSAPCLWQ